MQELLYYLESDHYNLFEITRCSSHFIEVKISIRLQKMGIIVKFVTYFFEINYNDWTLVLFCKLN